MEIGQTSVRKQPPPEVFKLINPMIARLLRSPFHRGLSKHLMLLTFRGRKSGQRYTTPVGYLQKVIA